MRRGAHLGFSGFLAALALALIAGGAAADDSEDCRVKSGPVAIEACDRVINSSRSTKQQIIDAHINRGQEYYTAKDYDRAIADFDIAISMGPREPIAYGNRGNCWYVKKEYDRAIADYTQAINLERNYTAAYTGRGMAEEAKGDIVSARADYRAALSVPQKFQDGKWAHDKARERLGALGN
jgi:tetratricopeptide (TPR) repeat protein